MKLDRILSVILKVNKEGPRICAKYFHEPASELRTRGTCSDAHVFSPKSFRLGFYQHFTMQTPQDFFELSADFQNSGRKAAPADSDSVWTPLDKWQADR